MPDLTNTEWISKLEGRISKLEGKLEGPPAVTERILALEKQVTTNSDRIDYNLKDIQRDLESHLKEAKEAKIETTATLLDGRVKRLEMAKEESDHRRWVLIMAVIGAVLAFIFNVIILFFKR